MTDVAATIKLGDVWRYPYLWKREDRVGDTEGRKKRPVAVVLLIQGSAGKQEVMFVPITSQPQVGNPFAVRIPDIEKKRAGLDVHMDLWVITDEHNIDAPMQSYYFEPSGQMGAFSTVFIKKVQAQKIEAIKARKSSAVRRNKILL
jgi:hypothetical protein